MTGRSSCGSCRLWHFHWTCFAKSFSRPGFLGWGPFLLYIHCSSSVARAGLLPKLLKGRILSDLGGCFFVGGSETDLVG